MKILVLNCGSSSVKYKLIDTATDAVLAEGGVEKIGLPDGFLTYKKADGSKAVIELGQTDHNGSVKATAWCTEPRSSARACSSPTRSRT